MDAEALVDELLALFGRGKHYACALCHRHIGRRDDTCSDCEAMLRHLDKPHDGPPKPPAPRAS